MSGRHRGIIIVSILAMVLGAAVVACSDGHHRCGHGRGHGHTKVGGGDTDDDATPDLDATTAGDVSRIPADAQVGDPDASDPDGDTEAGADASAD